MKFNTKISFGNGSNPLNAQNELGIKCVNIANNIMVARLEALESDVEVYLMKPNLNEGGQHSVFSLPNTLTPDSPDPTIPASGEFHFYTEKVSHSGVVITPNENGLGCTVNAGTLFSGELRPGESVIVGNLKITGE